MSDHHTSVSESARNQDLSGAEALRDVVQFAPSSVSAKSRGTYVPPSVHRIELVFTAGAATGADDGLAGAS